LVEGIILSRLESFYEASIPYKHVLSHFETHEFPTPKKPSGDVCPRAFLKDAKILDDLFFTTTGILVTTVFLLIRGPKIFPKEIKTAPQIYRFSSKYEK